VKIAEELIRLGQQLAAERDAASDLWSWLPSRKVADKHHGDYSSEHCPSTRDVMIEAAMYIAHLEDSDEDHKVGCLAHQKDAAEPLDEEEQEWFQRCPCGEDHDEPAPDPVSVPQPVEQGDDKGLRATDVIVAVNERPVHDVVEIVAVLLLVQQRHGRDCRAAVDVLRDGKLVHLDVQLPLKITRLAVASPDQRPTEEA